MLFITGSHLYSIFHEYPARMPCQCTLNDLVSLLVSSYAETELIMDGSIDLAEDLSLCLSVLMSFIRSRAPAEVSILQQVLSMEFLPPLSALMHIPAPLVGGFVLPI